VLAVGKRKHVGGHDASQMARCLDRTQAGADREDGQQISFGGAFDLWFGIGSRTEMVGKVRQMLHVDEDVKQAALGHAPHHLKVQPLRVPRSLLRRRRHHLRPNSNPRRLQRARRLGQR